MPASGSIPRFPESVDEAVPTGTPYALICKELLLDRGRIIGGIGFVLVWVLPAAPAHAEMTVEFGGRIDAIYTYEVAEGRYLTPGDAWEGGGQE